MCLTAHHNTLNGYEVIIYEMSIPLNAYRLNYLFYFPHRYIKKYHCLYFHYRFALSIKGMRQEEQWECALNICMGIFFVIYCEYKLFPQR